MIQGQFWPFVSFGRRSIASDVAYTTRSGRIGTNSSQASVNREKKKKKLKRNTDAQAAALVAAPRVEPHWTPMWHPPSRFNAS